MISSQGITDRELTITHLVIIRIVFIYSNYTLESPVFSVVVNGMDSLENSPVVLFNLTHRQVC